MIGRSATVLLLALAVGCGRPAPDAPSGATAGPPLATVTAAELKQAVASADAPVVLVNMWATWCGPCREEFPDLLRLANAYRDRGVRLVLVSWDDDPAVARAFLAKQGVDFPSYLKDGDESNTRFIEKFEPKWSGAFPTTMIYDRNGQLRQIVEGKRTYAQFEQAVQAVLPSKTQ